MSVGSVLLQPQRVRRTATAHDGGPIYDDAIALAVRISFDAANGGRILELLEEACEGAAERLVARIEGGLDAAVQKLEQRLQGLISGVDGLAAGIGAIHDAESAVAAARQALELLTGAADALTIERLRTEIGAIVEILEQDLGLGPAFLQQQALALLEDVAHHLAQAPPESNPELRRNRLQVVALLRRQRRRLDDDALEFPALDPERMAERLFQLIENTRVPETAQRIAAAGKAVTDGVGIGGDLTKAVPFTGFGPGTLGAAAVPKAAPDEDPYCWYASWVRGEDVRGPDPTALSLFTTADGTYTFKRYKPGPLETIAYVSAVAGNGLELLLHLISLEEGDYVSNTFHAFSQTGIGTYKLAKREPVNSLFEWLVLRIGLTLIASLEGIQTKGKFWLAFRGWFCTLLIPDAFEMYLYKAASDTARDALLNFLTLRNYDGPGSPPDSGPDNRPLNRTKLDSTVDLSILGLDQLMFVLFPRKDYEQPFASVGQGFKILLLWEVVINWAFGFAGIAIGILVGELLAGARDFSVIPTQIKRMLLSASISFIPSLYQSCEGDTAKGKYNPYGGPDFMGYENFGTLTPPGTARVKADNKDAPYKLPYAPGSSVYCVQGNQGLISHNFLNIQQTYAYDFCLNEDVEILAARPGTVVAWWEDVENDSMGNPISWNFIAIRHDVDDAGNALAIDQRFDLGPGGVPVRTIAIYGHGRKNSVTTALNINGLTPPARSGGFAAVDSSVPAVKVKRGMPIMLAGSTGVSFNNHLHMHVIPDPGPDPGGGALVPTDFVGNGNSMPFVFADVDRFFTPKGVPMRLNFYSSSTERIPAVT
jgi:hypothetical protein